MTSFKKTFLDFFNLQHYGTLQDQPIYYYQLWITIIKIVELNLYCLISLIMINFKILNLQDIL